MLILSLVRNYLPAHKQIVDGGWDIGQAAEKAYDLQNKVVGCVGTGRIGTLVLERLKVNAAWLVINACFTRPVIGICATYGKSTAYTAGCFAHAMLVIQSSFCVLCSAPAMLSSDAQRQAAKCGFLNGSLCGTDKIMYNFYKSYNRMFIMCEEPSS